MLGSIAWGIDLAARELLLFALFWFLIGAIDELAIDLAWLWQKLRGRARTARLNAPPASQLSGRIAVFIPAWSEAEVIGTTIACLLRAWPQPELRVYIGCYRNDTPTIAAAMAAVGGDVRVRIVIADRRGPTTKADCLNRLDAALREDEARMGERFRGVVFHDAEDMVHRQALPAIDRALDSCDFVQLPVRPEPGPGGHWISGHYCDEFAEAHAKGMVVREALGAALPAAGVGCGIARAMLDRLMAAREAQGGKGQGPGGPFAAEALTEDYELGLLIARLGGRGRFLRLRDADGSLVATRSLFPDELDAAIRQKTRWIHGIALQGWDRLGWVRRPVDVWMALRDRRGPLTALVVAAAYLLMVLELLAMVLHAGSGVPAAPTSPVLRTMMTIGFANLGWRAAMRAAFTGREYGWREGLRAVVRIPLANVILIISGRRAFAAYLRALAGAPVAWDKTRHRLHAAGLAAAVREPAAQPLAAVPAGAVA
ncbi:MAG: glycosyl transferase family protein [Sphingomonadales bacterium]|nr:glycosyl transferase family protein [Sphingomonadales bacterium]